MPALGDLHTYATMVRSFEGIGYSCTTFDRFSPDRPDLILRHDVDIDLGTALAMARMESVHAWTATFFFLLKSETYDLTKNADREILLEVAKLGHHIGLHFDRACYGPSVDIDVAVAQECEALEQILERPIRVVAPHRPRATCPEWLGWDHEPGGRLQAYHPRYFVAAAYVSDSAGRWAHGHPLDQPKISEGRGIQILTHPHLWGECP